MAKRSDRNDSGPTAVIAVLSLLIAVIALIPAFGQWLSPRAPAQQPALMEQKPAAEAPLRVQPAPQKQPAANAPPPVPAAVDAEPPVREPHPAETASPPPSTRPVARAGYAVVEISRHFGWEGMFGSHSIVVNDEERGRLGNADRRRVRVEPGEVVVQLRAQPLNNSNRLQFTLAAGDTVKIICRQTVIGIGCLHIPRQ